MIDHTLENRIRRKSVARASEHDQERRESLMEVADEQQSTEINVRGHGMLDAFGRGHCHVDMLVRTGWED